MKKILAINPGATSTKVAIFDGIGGLCPLISLGGSGGLCC